MTSGFGGGSAFRFRMRVSRVKCSAHVSDDNRGITFVENDTTFQCGRLEHVVAVVLESVDIKHSMIS